MSLLFLWGPVLTLSISTWQKGTPWTDGLKKLALVAIRCILPRDKHGSLRDCFIEADLTQEFLPA